MGRSRADGFPCKILGGALIVTGFGAAFAPSYLEFHSPQEPPMTADSDPREREARAYMKIGEAVGGLVIMFGGFGTAFVGYAVFRRGRRYVMELATDSNTGTRAKVLYLRAFDSDGVGSRLSVSSDEEQLIKSLGKIGTAIAVGMPGENLPQIGAPRIYYRDDEWRDRVEELIRSARLVLIRTGIGDGLRWEVEHVIRCVRPEQLLIVVGDEASLVAFQIWTSPVIRWPEAGVAFKRCLSTSIRGFVILDGHWSPTCIPLKRFSFLRGGPFHFREFRSALRPVILSIGEGGGRPPDGTVFVERKMSPGTPRGVHDERFAIHLNETLQQAMRARKISSTGWGVIALAFVVPFASAAMGYSNAAQAGDQVEQMGMGFVLLVLVTSLALKGRGALVQSYGRVFVGVLLALWALGTAAQQWGQANAQKTFISEAQQMQALQAARFADLGKRFEAIDLTTVLAPEAMTSAAGIVAGRDTISKYRALLAERKAMLTSTITESERFFDTRSLTEADKRILLASWERSKGLIIKIYGDLDTVQGAVVTAISDVLDWAATQKAKLVARNGQLVFASAQQQTELQVLLAKLEAAEAKQEQVLQEVASQKKAQASIDAAADARVARRLRSMKSPENNLE